MTYSERAKITPICDLTVIEMKNKVSDNFTYMQGKLSEILINAINSNLSLDYCKQLIRMGAYLNYKNSKTSVIKEILDNDCLDLLKFFLDESFQEVIYHQERAGMFSVHNYFLEIENWELDLYPLNSSVLYLTKYKTKYLKEKEEAEEKEKLEQLINNDEAAINLSEWKKLISWNGIFYK